MIDNRRAYSRVDANSAVEILSGDDSSVRGAAYDVSRGGLQLECDPATIARALPGSQPGVELRVRVTLPFLTRPPKRVEAACRVVHVGEHPDGGLRMGLRFLCLEGDGEEDIESYVLERMRYA